MSTDLRVETEENFKHEAIIRTGVERGMFKIFCYLSYEAVITYRRLYIVGGRVKGVIGGVGRETDGTGRVIGTGRMIEWWMI